MTDPTAPPDFGASAAEAASALAGLKGPAEDAAGAIDRAFAKAAESLAASLTKAALTGKLSLADLARAAIEAVDALAKTSISGSGRGGGGGGLGDALAAAIGGAFSGGPLSGALADGGPVTPGGAYLVGERGPELFRPAASGDIGPVGAGGGLTVNLTVQGAADPAAFVRSEAQLAQALARATSLGAR